MGALIGFLLGLTLGAALGVGLMGLLVAASREEDRG